MAGEQQDQISTPIVPNDANFVLKFANTNFNRAVTIEPDTETIIPLNLKKKLMIKISNAHLTEGN